MQTIIWLEVMEAKQAVFLDKDGTLIPDIPYNVDPERITLNAGVIEGLQKLQKHFLLFVVSNQSGVAKGLFKEGALEQVKDKLLSLFEQSHITLNGFYFCPHDPEGTVAPYAIECNCRKPKPGMLLHAAAEHQLDLSKSWMIGDILNDVEAGKTAGCSSILIHNGNETEWDTANKPLRIPDFRADNFLQAAEFINQNKKKQDDVRTG